MDNNFTPRKICESNLAFNIPIYQRLFTWEEEQINQLLDDMKNQCKKSSDSPYYIGMLTIHKQDNGNNDLVDGQQRITVLSIIATVFQKYFAEWSKMKGKLKLSARADDQAYLQSMFDNEISEEVCNKRMADGKSTVESWIDNNFSNDDKRIRFAKYVFNYCTFFIAWLPEQYKTKDLNKYFEAMNSTGKNLESHEIIKVEKYLRSMETEQSFYTAVWNLVSDMDHLLIRRKTNEQEDDYRERYRKAIGEFDNRFKDKNFIDLINDFKSEDKSSTDEELHKSLREIKADGHNPNVRRQDKYYGEGWHSMLNFPEFMLQVLYLQLPKTERSLVNVNVLFDVHRLQETVDKHTANWTEVDWKHFGQELLRYRLLFDYYIIRIPNSEAGGYELEFSEPKDGEIDSSVIAQMQSYLYVDSSSKTYYRWVVPYLEYLKSSTEIHMADLFVNLHRIDDDIDEHSIIYLEDESSISYGSRRTVYFLRRLDFYLWLGNHKAGNTSDKSYSIVDRFVFKRSINSQEHLHPQNDKERDEYKPWYDEKDKFGNLFLITSSFNSSQSDDSINTKFGRIKDQIEYSRIESIKLYFIFMFCAEGEHNWNLNNMKKHQDDMLALLRLSYKDCSVTEIHCFLEEIKDYYKALVSKVSMTNSAFAESTKYVQ